MLQKKLTLISIDAALKKHQMYAHRPGRASVQSKTDQDLTANKNCDIEVTNAGKGATEKYEKNRCALFAKLKQLGMRPGTIREYWQKCYCSAKRMACLIQDYFRLNNLRLLLQRNSFIILASY